MERIALLFPGQGAQNPDVREELYNNYPVAKQTWEEASDILGFDIYRLCTDEGAIAFNRAENVQTSIVTSSVAAFRVYMNEIGIMPVLSAGHSLGEISALTCSGAIDFRDAIKIVIVRGMLMQEVVNQSVGIMASFICNDVECISWIENKCTQYQNKGLTVVISNYNSLYQIAISGHREAVYKICDSITSWGGNAIPLTIEGPFHSPLMCTIADKFMQELKEIPFHFLKFPVISNVNAVPYGDINEIVSNLHMQMTKPVQWYKAMRYLKQYGVDIAFEMGTEEVLKNIMLDYKNGFSVVTLKNMDSITEMQNKLSSIQSSKKETLKKAKIRFISRCLAMVVCTKNNNHDIGAFEVGVVKRYNEVKQMLQAIESGGVEPSFDQLHKAINMLESAFQTKKVPVEEQNKRLELIFCETGIKYLFG